MLELIFQGYIEWMYTLVLEVWNYFSTSLLDIMSLDLAYIKSHVPIIPDIIGVLLAAGWALLLGNLVFQALKSMAAGLGFEAEDPKLLFGRTSVFAFLLLASPQLCELGLNLTSRVIALLKVPDAIDVHLIDAGLFGNLTAGWLVVIVGDLFLMVQVLKLLLKIAEQYVVLSTLTITAPLAFSMGGSGSTAPIFSGWCRMYGSMCLLMVTNMMFFKMLLSVMSAIPSGLDVIPWLVLISSITKTARKADDIITRIGLNPAMTGEKRGRSLPGMLVSSVLRGAASQVTRSILNKAGGDGRDGGGGGIAAGAVAGGLASGFFCPGQHKSAASTIRQEQARTFTKDISPHQNVAGESVRRQEQPQQSGLAQNGGILSAAINQADQFTKRMRNSAIEPGVHRGTSYVQSPSGFEERQSTRSGMAGKREALLNADKTIRRGIFSGIFSGVRGGSFGSGKNGGSGFSGGRNGSFGTERTGGDSFSSGRGRSFGTGRTGSGSFSGGRSGSFGAERTGGSFSNGRGGNLGTGRTGSGGFSGGQRVQLEGGPRLETIEKSAGRFNGERGSSFSSRDFQKQPKSGTGTAGIVLREFPGGRERTQPATVSPASPAFRNDRIPWAGTRSTHRIPFTEERTTGMRSVFSRTGTAGTTLQPRTAQQPGEALNARQDSPPLSREDQALQTRFKPAQQKARQTAALDKVLQNKTAMVHSGPAAVKQDVHAKLLTNSRLTKRERQRKDPAVRPKSATLPKPPAVRRYIPKQRGGDRRGK